MIEDGYEKNYARLALDLPKADFGARALELGFSPAQDGVKIAFLGREYRLDPTGVTAVDGLPSSSNHRSLLIHYLFSPGRGGPGETFLTLSQLPGHIRGRQDPAADFTHDPILRAYGDDYPGFRKAAIKLGGEELPAAQDGWRVWVFLVLPQVKIKLGYCPADEEFPTEVWTRFDNLALSYLGFECLAFLQGALSRALADLKEG
ncbi:MAG: DUF3786 domain-containing protein [Deltaproteobacteria bacterium]|jgi:hypothetical protein|nr:DUF3786 domain-containing protein [Deltaproteobacteria bacterium]